MASWKPPADVGDNEHVGRRLFDEPKLRGAEGQKPFSDPELFNFEEKRDEETSLDRLGASGVDRRVKGYLLPRAESQANNRKPPVSFDGWAVVPTKELRKARKGCESLAVVASPIKGAGLEANDYHAHVVRPLSTKPIHFALYLRWIFMSQGKVERGGSMVTDAAETVADAAEGCESNGRPTRRSLFAALKALFSRKAD